jgi:hypothetical protein
MSSDNQVKVIVPPPVFLLLHSCGSPLKGEPFDLCGVNG